MTYTEAERAYAAGFMDGEGSIMILNNYGVRRKDGTHKLFPHVVLSVANTDKSSIDWMTERWPASRHQFIPQTDKHKKKYIATWTAYRAETLIWAMLPYLVIKQRQAMIALACFDTMAPKGGNKLQPGTLALRRHLRTIIQAMNKRGVAA